MNDGLRGKVVMVVGGTGRLGAALVRALLDAGCGVALPVRRPWQVERVRSTYPGARVLVGLVAPQDGEAAAGFVKGSEDALGPLAGVVVTAGRRSEAPVGSDAAGELAELLEANLLAGATLVRAAVARLRRRKSGRILFVGRSEEATSCANETAAAAVVRGYVAGLARELQGTGVAAAALLATRPQDPPTATAVAGLLAALFAPSLAGPLLPLAD